MTDQQPDPRFPPFECPTCGRTGRCYFGTPCPCPPGTVHSHRCIPGLRITPPKITDPAERAASVKAATERTITHAPVEP